MFISKTSNTHENAAIPEPGDAIPVMSPEGLAEFSEQVAARIYERVAPFEMTAWLTREPVSFQERTRGRKLSLKPGDRWGEALFDCAWFRFFTVVPEGAQGKLVARIDINGELSIVDGQGEPVRGLTCKKSDFERSLGTPTKTIYVLPEQSQKPGPLELWAEAGFNDLFGKISGEGKIEFAEVCLCREDIRALFYDLESLSDLVAGLPPQDPLRNAVLEAAAKAERNLDAFAPESVAIARTILTPLFAPSAAPSALKVSAIGHAHLDLAWLWPIRETIRKGARTFATALYNIERYPEYIFGCSQPQLFDWTKQHYPALYARVKEAVRAGRIEPLGTFWVEPDCNIPCGESFVRQVLFGTRFFKDEFGIVPRFCWEPDAFGYNGQLPQILKKSGSDFFVTQKLSWSVINRFPHHSFEWEGIDGTTILAHMLPEETYNGPAAPHSLRKISDEYAQKEVSNHALMVFGIGDGGGGPDAEHIERLRRARHLADLPAVEQRPVAEFLKLWADAAGAFPHWTGELYLERHQGTLTTQALNKRNNRLCEIGLRELEWAAVLAERFAGIPYPADELDLLWKEVLLFQFHDILPGSSIKRVYDECNARYALMLEKMETLIDERYRALAALVQSNASHLVFNSLPWARSAWLQVDGQWRFVKTPGMGYAELPEPIEMTGLLAEDNRIENERLAIEFADDGSLASVFDKECRRETLANGERGNDFVVFEDTGDAWDFAINYEEKDVWIYLRQTPERPSLESRRTYVDGPRAIVEQTYRYRSSKIHQRVILELGMPHLTFETRVNWAEPKSMLRVRFPVAVNAPSARFEIPFGSITRSTGEETLIDKAQIEVAGHQWVDLSQSDFGVALLNDCKYGFRVKGHTLDMNCLRSVPHPGAPLISKGDLSDTDVHEYTDLGEHRFRYALLPHAGKMSESELTRAARAFNVPMRVVPHGLNPAAQLPGEFSWIRVDNPSVELPAIKRAEDGRGWIVRLLNTTPADQEVVIWLPAPVQSLVETDLAEAHSAITYPVGEDRSIRLTMTRFEIKTIRCVFEEA